MGRQENQCEDQQLGSQIVLGADLGSAMCKDHVQVNHLDSQLIIFKIWLIQHHRGVLRNE